MPALHLHGTPCFYMLGPSFPDHLSPVHWFFHFYVFGNRYGDSASGWLCIFHQDPREPGRGVAYVVDLESTEPTVSALGPEVSLPSNPVSPTLLGGPQGSGVRSESVLLILKLAKCFSNWLSVSSPWCKVTLVKCPWCLLGSEIQRIWIYYLGLLEKFIVLGGLGGSSHTRKYSYCMQAAFSLGLT